MGSEHFHGARLSLTSLALLIALRGGAVVKQGRQKSILRKTALWAKMWTLHTVSVACSPFDPESWGFISPKLLPCLVPNEPWWMSVTASSSQLDLGMGEATGILVLIPEHLNILGLSISDFSNTFHITMPLPQFHLFPTRSCYSWVSWGWVLILCCGCWIWASWIFSTVTVFGCY